MSNPHIELVKKWLADPKSVSAEALERAYADADAVATIYADVANAASFAARAAITEHWGKEHAADAAAAYAARAANAKHWVEKYEELTR